MSSTPPPNQTNPEPSSAFAFFTSRIARFNASGPEEGATAPAVDSSTGDSTGEFIRFRASTGDLSSGGGSWATTGPVDMGVVQASSSDTTSHTSVLRSNQTEATNYDRFIARNSGGSQASSQISSVSDRLRGGIRNVAASISKDLNRDYMEVDDPRGVSALGGLPQDFQTLRSPAAGGRVPSSPSGAGVTRNLNEMSVSSPSPGRLKRELESLSDHKPTALGVDIKPSKDKANDKYPIALVSGSFTTGRHLCLGRVGARGKVCLEPKAECEVVSHQNKPPAIDAPHPVYIVDISGANGTGGKATGLLTPAIRASIFENHPIGRAHKDSLHTIQEWSAVFEYVHSHQKDLTRGVELNPADQEDTERFFDSLSQHACTPYHKRVKVEVAPATPGLSTSATPEMQELWTKFRGLHDKVANAVDSANKVILAQVYLMGVPGEGQLHANVWAGIDSLESRMVEFEDDKMPQMDGRLAAMKDRVEAHAAQVATHLGNIESILTDTAADARTARVEATRARELAGQHQLTGNLDARVRTVESDLLEAGRAMNGFMTAIEGLQNQMRDAVRKVGGGAAGVPLDVSFKTHTDQRLLALEQKTGGSQAVCIRSRHHFNTQADVQAWLAKHGLKDRSCFQYIYDLSILLGRVSKRALTREEVGQDAERSAKLKLSTEELAVIAAARTEVPEALAGTTPPSHVDHPFGNMMDFASWDHEDGQNGTRPTIQAALDSKYEEIHTSISLQFGDKPDVCDVFSGMLDKAYQGWISFARVVEKSYREFLTTTFMGKNCTKDEKAQVWTLITKFADVYWREVAKVRVGAKSVDHSTKPEVANQAMMWAALQGIAKHDEFEAKRFIEHELVHPKIQMFLFRTKASRDELSAFTTRISSVNTQCTSSSSAVAALETKLARAMQRVDQLESKVGRLQQGGQGGGKGKQRRKQADEAVEEE